jgi:hypothetical protein
MSFDVRGSCACREQSGFHRPRRFVVRASRCRPELIWSSETTMSFRARLRLAERCKHAGALRSRSALGGISLKVSVRTERQYAPGVSTHWASARTAGPLPDVRPAVHRRPMTRERVGRRTLLRVHASARVDGHALAVTIPFDPRHLHRRALRRKPPTKDLPRIAINPRLPSRISARNPRACSRTRYPCPSRTRYPCPSRTRYPYACPCPCRSRSCFRCPSRSPSPSSLPTPAGRAGIRRPIVTRAAASTQHDRTAQREPETHRCRISQNRSPQCPSVFTSLGQAKPGPK